MPVVVWLAATMVMMVAVRTANVPGTEPQSKALRLLGMATYPLYLVHYIAGATLMGVLLSAGWDPLATLATSFVAMLAGAVALTAAIESGPRRRLAGLIDLVFRWRPDQARPTASSR